MKRFQEWSENQLYTKHIQKLGKISQRKSPEQTKSMTLVRRKRLLTSNNEESTSGSQKKEFIPLNSLPSAAREVFNKVVKTHRVMTLHDKEVLLENFLLCRRIINAPPIISQKQHQREYQTHRSAVSGMMKRKSSVKLRDTSYKSYLQGMSSRAEAAIKGRFLIKLQISNIMLIKSKVQSKSEYSYQLQICSSRNKTSDLMDYQQFTSRWLSFGLNRVPPTLKLKIMGIRKNNQSEIGTFSIDLSDFAKERQTLRKKTVEPLRKDSQIIGTVELVAEVIANRKH